MILESDYMLVDTKIKNEYEKISQLFFLLTSVLSRVDEREESV